MGPSNAGGLIAGSLLGAGLGYGYGGYPRIWILSADGILVRSSIQTKKRLTWPPFSRRAHIRKVRVAETLAAYAHELQGSWALASGRIVPAKVKRKSACLQGPLSQRARSVNVGAIQNGSLSHEHYSSPPSKTLRAAMGCTVRFAGNPGRAKDGPIERLTGQHCSARGKGQRKTRRG
jgi:hypothetical protein